MLLASVRSAVRDHRLIAQGDHVIAACSGGADSVSMTHALASLTSQLGFSMTVASVDHGLRPGADKDVQVAQRLAESLDLPFRSLKVHVDRASPSLMAQARTARYAALRKLALTVGAQSIAVAHTMDDQAETVLDRMTRGAGVRGIAAMSLGKSDGLIRPLLAVRRREVEGYASHHALRFVSDPSNQDSTFKRVRIRNTLLPALREENPRIVEALAQLAADAGAHSSLVAELAEQAVATLDEAPTLEQLRNLPEAVRMRILSLWAARRFGVDLSQSHRLDLNRAIFYGKGEVRLGKGWQIEVVGARLVGRNETSRPPQTTLSPDASARGDNPIESDKTQ